MSDAAGSHEVEDPDFRYYGYVPFGGIALIYMALFAISAILHTFQMTKSRYWIVVPTLVAGSALEAAGWGCRYWSSQSPQEKMPFLIQIVVLIFAPVFYSAFNYTVVGIAIATLGPRYALLSGKKYGWTFVCADVASLVPQCIGGYLTATADEGEEPTLGNNILLGGIITQLFCMLAFSTVAISFFIKWSRERTETDFDRVYSADIPLNDMEANKRYVRSRSEGRPSISDWNWILLAVAISSACIIIRGFYRTAELGQGWDGSIMTTQAFQNFLDGLPMVIATGVFNALNPGPNVIHMFFRGMRGADKFTGLLPTKSWKGIMAT